MTDTVKNVVIFAVGAVIGSAVTYFILNKKYKKISDEEIQSVRDVYKKKEEALKDMASEQAEKMAQEIVANAIPEEDDISDAKEVDDEMKDNRPYVIDPDDFGEEGYRTVSLDYYADGVLAYMDSGAVARSIIEPEEVDEIVGRDSLTRFGEYERDTVYVRNDKTKTDYEILANVDKFSDIY